jgi:hypothetical protein
LRHKLGKEFKLKEIEELGVLNPINEKLVQVLKPIANRLGYFCDENVVLDENGQKLSKTPFILKPCGDGTNCGKVVKLLNVNFTVINDKKFCKSASGNFSLGRF